MASGRSHAGGGVALVAALALLLVACGDDYGGSEDEEPESEANPSADEEPADAAALFDRDACELLDDDQIAFVLGAGAEEESAPGDASIAQPAACTWTVGDGAIDVADPEISAITVLLGDHQIFDNTRELAEDGEDYEELDDVGDDAYVGAGQGGVQVGAAGITVTPIGTDVNSDATHDVIVDLLEQVAENVENTPQSTS